MCVGVVSPLSMAAGDQGRWTFSFDWPKNTRRGVAEVRGDTLGLALLAAGLPTYRRAFPAATGWSGASGHWNRWLATLTRRFAHRPTSVPPHLLNYHTLRYPTIPALKTKRETGPARPRDWEDHTRVGCYGTCPKVSRRVICQ